MLAGKYLGDDRNIDLFSINACLGGYLHIKARLQMNCLEKKNVFLKLIVAVGKVGLSCIG